MSAPVEAAGTEKGPLAPEGARQNAPARPAGMVRIELPDGALRWRDSLDEAVLRRRAQYVAGVEYLARTLEAEEPLVWEEDAVTLALTGTNPADLPARTYRAAKELWQRIRVELGLPARMAAHVGKIEADVEAAGFAGSDVTRCLALAAIAPVGRIALSEALALALPEAERRELAPLGRAHDDESLVHAFPASGAPLEGGSFVYGEAELLREKLRGYAEGLDIRLIRYVGFRLHKKEPPRLDVREVFVPSDVELRPAAEAQLQEAVLLKTAVLEERGALPPLWGGRAPARSGGPALAFRDVFARHSNLVVLGDPGAGKTTLLRWLAVVAGAGEFSLALELGTSERLLPIPVSVGRLAELRRALGWGGVSVPDALARYLHDRRLGEEGEIKRLLARQLELGRCLVLLDGLDEVKGEERDAIRSWLEVFAAAHPGNRYVVTSRHHGYAGIELPGGALEVVLCPFTDEQVQRYVRVFHGAYVRWETGAEPATEAGAERLLDALRAIPRLWALARNPLMLSAFALIHRAEGRLPRHRVQAYELFARALCETWAEVRRLVSGGGQDAVIEYEEEALPILGELALALHEHHPSGVAPEELVVSRLAAALRGQRGITEDEAQRAARTFLRRAGEDVQLLLERGAGAWGFLHLTFQEFFVAAGLHAAERFEEVALSHLFHPRWEEVLRLGVGYMALAQKRPTAARRFVERVLQHQEPEPRRWVTSLLGEQIPLAALLAAEAGETLPVALQERIADALAGWLQTAPRGVSARYLTELSATDFAAVAGASMQRLLGDSSSAVRATGAWSLGMLRFAVAAEPLLALFEDESGEVREAAAAAFGRLSAEGAAERLAELYQRGSSAARGGVMIALQELGVRAPWDLVSRGLNDPDDTVRAEATRALRPEWNEAHVALEVAARDPSPRVRAAAASLCWIFGPRAAPLSPSVDALDAG